MKGEYNLHSILNRKQMFLDFSIIIVTYIHLTHT